MARRGRQPAAHLSATCLILARREALVNSLLAIKKEGRELLKRQLPALRANLPGQKLQLELKCRYWI